MWASPDEPVPIIPNYVLLCCTNSTQTPAPYEPRLNCLRQQWRIVQNLKNGWWRQWLREYFPELTWRTRWNLLHDHNGAVIELLHSLQEAMVLYFYHKYWFFLTITVFKLVFDIEGPRNSDTSPCFGSRWWGHE